MTKKRKLQLLRLIAPFGALLLALVISSLFVLAIKVNPASVYSTMLSFCLGRADSIGILLFYATPLIFSGLAFAVAMKGGIFNIGTEGQYLAGAVASSWCAFSLHGLPLWIHLPLCVLVAMAGGALWAFIPAWLKVKRGVHEVITTIMFNYIAYQLINWFVRVNMDMNQKIPEGVGSPIVRTPYFDDSAIMPRLNPLLNSIGLSVPDHVYINWFLPLAVLLAFGIWYLLNRTPYGYKIRAVGFAPDACQTSGIDAGTVKFRTFLFSGALSGLIGMSHLLCYFKTLDMDFPHGFGFNGMAVALMGGNHPAGIVAAAVLFGFLSRGGEGVQAYLQVPLEIITIMQAVIILSVVAVTTTVERYISVREKENIGFWERIARYRMTTRILRWGRKNNG